MSISSLGYVVVRGPVSEWRTFARDVLGLQEVPQSREDRAYFRTDDYIYRVAVVDGPPGPDALLAAGWEMPNTETFEALVAHLRHHGYDANEDDELAKERRVRRLATVTDPDGLVLEFYLGFTRDFAPFASPRGVTFVCDELGLGHLFLSSQQPAKTVEFYRDVLGFRPTDTIDVMGTDAVFMHINPRHHSVAVASIPNLTGLGHLMLEVTKLEDVGRALDQVKSGAAEMAMDMGEHSNDHMISFYVVTPSGFQIEYGWNGALVDDETWTPAHYVVTSNWGHQMADGTSFPKRPAL
ncbi:VOC family protein [Gordonia terrae]|uniref:VOC family protein n=1 Tax=Gordonia terrae TaxID=2055 RepID=UPI003F6C98E8